METVYLHLGQDTVIRSEEIIGIFDLEKTTISKGTRDYLAAATSGGQVVNVTYEMPKSFVVVQKEKTGKQTVYISQISPATLFKRMGFIDTISNV